MNAYDHMMGLLRRYHTNGADAERLANEMLVSGYNVVKDFVERQVGAPWEWSPAMEKFYRDTDAFVYELLVWHHQPGRAAERERVALDISRRIPQGGRVLCLGDGISFDACTVSLRVPYAEVVSFEFEGYSAAFARRVIEDAGLNGRLRHVTQTAELPGVAYDALLCFDVLEHVPKPPSLVKDIARYLKPGGLAYVTEAFAEVHPLRPTHLRCNLRWAGRTIKLFESHGFAFEGMLTERVYVFKKGEPGRLTQNTSVRVMNCLRGVYRRSIMARRCATMGVNDLREAIQLEAPNFLCARLPVRQKCEFAEQQETGPA
jgi:SAM-dependent methyltransferase